MRIDQARDDPLAARIDHLGARWDLHVGRLADRADAVAFDDNCSVRPRRHAGAVDDGAADDGEGPLRRGRERTADCEQNEQSNKTEHSCSWPADTHTNQVE
jgi:hypothetical protein